VQALDGRYPARAGNRVELHIGELAFYQALEAAAAAARGSVWLAVNFLHPEFRFPSGRSLWDWLEALSASGLDIRVLFWRNPAFSDSPRIFHGTPGQLELLRGRRGGWMARWDSSPAHDVAALSPILRQHAPRGAPTAKRPPLRIQSPPR